MVSADSCYQIPVSFISEFRVTESLNLVMMFLVVYVTARVFSVRTSKMGVHS